MMAVTVAAAEGPSNDVVCKSPVRPPLHKKKMFFYELDLRQNRILHVSTAISEVLGYTPTEIIQNGLKWFVEQIHPDDLKNLNHLADRQLHAVVPWVYYRFKHKNGHYCRLYENRCLLHDTQGMPSFLIGKIELSE